MLTPILTPIVISLVYLRYCSSDVYVGSADISQSGDLNKYFHGKYIHAALWEAMISDHMGPRSRDATVIWSGCSAGSVAVFLNLDWTVEQFGGKVKDIIGVGDSGYAADLDNIDTLEGQPQLRDMAKQGYDMADGSGSLPSACLTMYEGEEWKCILPEYALKAVEYERYIIYHFQYDSYFVDSGLGYKKVETDAERQYAEMYRDQVTESVNQLLEEKEPAGVVMPAW